MVYLIYVRLSKVITYLTENNILIIDPIAASTSLIDGYPI